MAEYLDIVDENGIPTGQTAEREQAHAEGIRHRTSHVWLIRFREGKMQVLLQKRSDTKDSFPGCYDISSAGHIPAGVDFGPSALRELKEELGVEAAEEELIFCMDRSSFRESVFYGRPFRNREFNRVFALPCDREEVDFILQREEISAVKWMNMQDAIRAAEEEPERYCISLRELETVRQRMETFSDKSSE